MIGMLIDSSNEHYSEEPAEVDPQHVIPTPPVPLGLTEHKESAKSTSTGSKRRRERRIMQGDHTSQFSEQESQRKLRNKEAAKRCRARNKQRFDRLEERQLELQQELIEKRQELSRAKLQLEKYLSKNTLHNSINLGKEMTYNRLEEVTQDPTCVDEDEVNLILDTLKIKIGTTCKERQSMIDYYFKQWVHLSYPALHRFLMYTAELGCQDFGEEPLEWAKDLEEKVQFTPEQKSMIRSTRDFFVESKRILAEYIDSIHSTKHELEVEGGKLEHILDLLSGVITPYQCSQVILFCEKNKYKQEMHLWSQRHFNFITESIEEPPTRKKVKQ